LVPAKSWTEKLKDWRKKHDEHYAKVVMEPPEHVTMLKAIPIPGLILIMGAKGKGKSALAHGIAERLKTTRNMDAVLHLPTAPAEIAKRIQKLLPPWIKVVTHMNQWPKRCVVIFDEAAQGAHARRTQSGDAVELDNLMSVSRQRGQLIIFISHHSRKLDLNVIRDVDRIAWKSPTYAHYIFERSELTDFVLKGIDFFKDMKESKALRTTLVMDFHNLIFMEFTNTLPSYWSEDLSRLFEDIKTTRRGVLL
jgi:SpoVK/Ycf46/Vps4 family AAA+-type ATPase